MPELEPFIAQWRRNLAEKAGCTKEVLDELESHLREEIQRLRQTGHPPEQAMILATSRLGSPATLGAEFAKVARPAPWLPVRLVMVLYTVLILAVLFLGYSLVRGQNTRILLAVHVGAVTLGYSTSFFIGLLAICYVMQRPFRDLSAGQIKSVGRAVFALTAAATVLTLAGILLGCVWAEDHLGRYWGWDPKETGGACVLAWDFAMLLLFWLRRVPERLAIQLGLIGNIVVSAAWFGPNLLGVGLHAYGFNDTLAMGLLVFILAQLALFGVGFVPAGRLRSRAA